MAATRSLINDSSVTRFVKNLKTSANDSLTTRSKDLTLLSNIVARLIGTPLGSSCILILAVASRASTFLPLSDLWGLLARWCTLDILEGSSIVEWFSWLDVAHVSKHARTILEGIASTMLWSIWNFRNAWIFSMTKPKRRIFGILLFINLSCGFHLETQSVDLDG
ncbi:hypothetical protein Tco_0691036 [Tanacetum coccineum]